MGSIKRKNFFSYVCREFAMGQPRLYADVNARMRAYYRRKKKAKQSQRKVYHRSTTIEQETPQDFFDALHGEFGFTLDVCATATNAKCQRFFTIDDDALSQTWEGICWMNPPYGKTTALWMRKAYESAQQGATVVCLVPSRTEMRWWHEYAIKGEIRFVQGRLKFGGMPYNAPFPNAIVIFRPPPSVVSEVSHGTEKTTKEKDLMPMWPSRHDSLCEVPSSVV
jgi:phage N-6-adenine-methyltransferase